MLADRIPMFDLRSQDEKNRQNSIDDVDPFTKQHFEILIQKHFAEAMDLYQQMLLRELQRSVRVCASSRRTHKNLYDWLVQIVDPLYQSAYC